VKRLYVVLLFVLGFVAAGAFSGAVIADDHDHRHDDHRAHDHLRAAARAEHDPGRRPRRGRPGRGAAPE
jgi:hypothetical protein